MKPNRPQSPAPSDQKRSPRSSGTHNFMRSPAVKITYEVGDAVDAFCDHEKASERVRGWLKGIVVQLDGSKMVAVQFRSNVFLTDGWMVPDKILWFPTNSDQIRPFGSGKRTPVIKKEIPDY